MKRLLAAGETAIYQIAHAFRSGERGPLHLPEFTLVEWYRVGDQLDEAMAFLAKLATTLLPTAGEPELLSWRTAIERYADVDPFAITSAALRDLLVQREIAVPDRIDPKDRDTLLDLLFVDQVQSRLGMSRPAIVYHYPASQAALARVVRDREGNEVAERFELFVQGIELANGYHELLDPDELVCRNLAANGWRARDGKGALPTTSRLVDAMRHGLPPCAGVALGFDRLVMVANGLTDLRDVVTFPNG